MDRYLAAANALKALPIIGGYYFSVSLLISAVIALSLIKRKLKLESMQKYLRYLRQNNKISLNADEKGML